MSRRIKEIAATALARLNTALTLRRPVFLGVIAIVVLLLALLLVLSIGLSRHPG